MVFYNAINFSWIWILKMLLKVLFWISLNFLEKNHLNLSKPVLGNMLLNVGWFETLCYLYLKIKRVQYIIVNVF